MSDITLSASAHLSVSFLDNTLTLIDRDGEPFVAMRPIVEGMGLNWASQTTKIKSRYASTVAEIATVADDGKNRPMLCLPLRKLAGWLMTIHPNKVRPELRERIVRYQAECDDVLWSHWSQQRPAHQSSATIDTSRFLDELVRAGRWLARIDRNGNLVFTPVSDDAFVLRAEEWPKVIATTDFPKHLLPEVLAAVADRLGGSQP